VRSTRSAVRCAASCAVAVIALLCLRPRVCRAQEVTPAPELPAPTSPAAPAANDAPPASILPEAPPEAPPPPPRHKGLVLESGLGGLQFLGQFKHVAPLAPWAYTQLGFELFRWLLVYGYGELSFTDTSEAEDETHARAFPMFGFGGGVRVTIHATPRVAFFAQGEAGAMQADVPRGALGILGFHNAESLGATFGGRVGVEWYQVDRHMALGLGVGVRDLLGFKETIGSDTPLALDATAALRYTF
jgi:hypothetical protein